MAEPPPWRGSLLAWCSASELAGDDPLPAGTSLLVVLKELGLEQTDDVLADFAVLLAALVRAEAQPFLAVAAPPAVGLGITRPEAPGPPAKPPSPAYEDAFPALGGGAAPAMEVKKKKRIRSTIVPVSAATGTSGNIARLASGDLMAKRPLPSQKAQGTSGDAAGTSTPPRRGGGDSSGGGGGGFPCEGGGGSEGFPGALSMRDIATGSQVAVPAAVTIEPLVSPPAPQRDRHASLSPSAPPPMSSPRSPRAGAAPLILDDATASALDALDFSAHAGALRGLAWLHGRLVVEGLLNRCQELAFLFQLLRSAQAAAATAAGRGPCAALSFDASSSGGGESFFTSAVDVAAFGAVALGACLPLVVRLDPVPAMLVDDLVLRRVVPRAATELRASAARRPLSVRVGRGPADTPFREETDSRHHFRSAEQGRLYTNREASRDRFMRLLRGHREARRRLDDKKAKKLRAELPGEVGELLGTLLPGNLEWFCDLFVDQLARSALETEADDVLGSHKALVKADPGRLLRLHQRMSTRGGDMSAGGGGGSAAAAAQSSSFVMPGAKAEARRVGMRGGGEGGGGGSGGGAAASSPAQQAPRSAPAEVVELFSAGSEAFFLEFLELARDPLFLRHVEALLAARVSRQAEHWLAAADLHAAAAQTDAAPTTPARPARPLQPPSSPPSPSDWYEPRQPPSPLKQAALSPDAASAAGRMAWRMGTSALLAGDEANSLFARGHPLDGDETVDALLQLKLLARFLGFLAFRTHWPLSLTAAANASSPALAAAVRDSAAAHDDGGLGTGLDLHGLLGRFASRGMLVLAVPWLAELLRLLAWDLVFRATASFRRLLGALRALARRVGCAHAASFNGNTAMVVVELDAVLARLECLAPLPPPDPVAVPALALPPRLTVDGCCLIARRCFARHMCAPVSELLGTLAAAHRRSAAPGALPMKKVRPLRVNVAMAPEALRGGVDGAKALLPRQSERPVASTPARAGVGPVDAVAAEAPSTSPFKSAAAASAPTLVPKGVAAGAPLSSASLPPGTAPLEFRQLLQSSFFRRFPQLQRLADVVVDAVVHNCEALALGASGLFDAKDLHALRSASLRARKAAADAVEAHGMSAARMAMHALAPPTLSAAVRLVAAELTAAHCRGAGLAAVRSALDAHVARQRQRLQPTSAASPSKAKASPPLPPPSPPPPPPPLGAEALFLAPTASEVERLLAAVPAHLTSSTGAALRTALVALGQGESDCSGRDSGRGGVLGEEWLRHLAAGTVDMLVAALDDELAGRALPVGLLECLLAVLPRLWVWAAALALGPLTASGRPSWLLDALALVLRPRALACGPALAPFLAALLDAGLAALASLEHSLLHALARGRGRGRAKELGDALEALVSERSGAGAWWAASSARDRGGVEGGAWEPCRRLAARLSELASNGLI